MQDIKKYDRMSGIPENHKFYLVRILSYADQGGARYEDVIIASAINKELLEEYCSKNGMILKSESGWDEYSILERR